MGCACGSSMASSTRVEQVQRHHHQHARQRIAALQFPGDAVGVPRDFIRTRLRIDAVGLHVFVEADVADGIGVRVGVLQVRPLARIGIGEDDLRADLERRADGFDKRIGGLHRNVDGAVLFAFRPDRR